MSSLSIIESQLDLSACVNCENKSINSLHGWEFIEDLNGIKAALEVIQSATKTDVYKCAELYDLAYPGYVGDADFYIEKSKQGKVLYLGVGTGRIFSKMAEVNKNILGIDFSKEMLELLLQKYPKIKPSQVLLADALDPTLELDSYDTIVAPYSFPQAFDRNNMTMLFQNVESWLKPGGKFYTDVFSPYLIPFRKNGIENNIQNINRDTRVSIYITYDHKKQDMTEIAVIDHSGNRQAIEMHLYYHFPLEIINAIHESQLKLNLISGGYNGEDFNPANNDILVFESQK